MLDEEASKESGASIPQYINGQSTAMGESTCSLQDFHGQTIASDKISSDGAEIHSGEATQTKLKGIHTRVQRLSGFQRIQVTLYYTLQQQQQQQILLFEEIVYRINTIPQVAEANRGRKWRLINYITCKHFPS